MTAIETTPKSLVLYPPPVTIALTLGLPTQAQVTATVTLADGSKGIARWTDRSDGKLSVNDSGLVTVKANTPAGTYYVRAQADDDPNMFVELPVEVRTTGELDITIQ